NIDIKGKPKNVIQWKTSNPGFIRVSHGGVGRNIAHYLGLLNIPVTLLGAVGDDDEGREILEKLRNAHVQTKDVIQSKKDQTGKYVAILDEKGEMQISVSDMEVMRRVTPRYLIAKAGIIKKSRFVIMDANLTTQAIHYIASLCSREKIPLIVDPVSMVKSRKLLGILTKIDYLIPNSNELSSLTGVVLQKAADRQEAIHRLMKKGVKNLILTSGGRGIYIFSQKSPEVEFINIRKRKIVDSTGAGDALVAGMAYGLYHHYPLSRAVQIGMILSSLTIQSPESVYAHIDENGILKRL
ncbi:MAG: carbohydrate kinase family protein, partial [Candidatus Aminicenantes bacterium]|nr:carbohydrate kinase family protein [Candidatus Aminicenantes bacterium]